MPAQRTLVASIDAPILRRGKNVVRGSMTVRYQGVTELSYYTIAEITLSVPFSGPTEVVTLAESCVADHLAHTRTTKASNLRK
jgi:hypothetical protein